MTEEETLLQAKVRSELIDKMFEQVGIVRDSDLGIAIQKHMLKPMFHAHDCLVAHEQRNHSE